MFISGILDLVFLGRGSFFALFGARPQTLPLWVCVSDWRLLSNGAQAASGSGRGRAGRGRECHLRPRTTLHLPILVPIFLSARHRRRCSLQQASGPGRRSAGMLGRWRSYVEAMPVSAPAGGGASCWGKDRRRNWRHQAICTTSYFYLFRRFKF